MPAFESLKDTSASREIDLHQLSRDSKLLVTADFARIVVKRGLSFMDSFQRQVGWIVTRHSPDTIAVEVAFIVSEYEANFLLPRMRGKTTTLHKYKARYNAGLGALDKLDIFTVSGSTKPPVMPRTLSVQLSLFAGQLYISSYEDYVEIYRFLGISADILTIEMEKQGWKVSTDNFVLRDGQGRVGGGSGIKKSPINFLQILMSKIRRHGDGISKTDMGSLLEGKPFKKSYWE